MTEVSHSSLYGLRELDGRSRPARWFRDLVGDLVSDLGGADVVSRAELELCRRAAGLGVLAAELEAKLVQGEPVDAEALTRLVNAQSRVLGRLGLQRRPRQVGPTLGALALQYQRGGLS